MIFNGFFNEFKNLVWDLLCCVKEGLLLIVLPVQGQVEDSYCFPKIAQLGASCVNHASYFVCDDEL
jgi:hypothetical protein